MTSAGGLHRVLDEKNWNFDEVKTFLEKDSSSINDVDQHRDNPLLRVLKKKDCSPEVVMILLQFDADVNWKNKLGENSLNVALQFPGRDVIVEALLEKGAAVDSSSLWRALHGGASKSIIERLLDAGCSISELCRYSQHSTVLHCAVDHPLSELKQDVFQLLIDRGADVRAEGRWHSSVLCYALNMGNEASTIQLLMNAGASLNDCRHHASPLLCATLRDGGLLKTALVQFLIQSGASLKERHWASTPLEAALEICDYEIGAIKLLLVNCLPDEYPNKKYYLRAAVQNPRCDPAVVELLIQHGVDINEALEFNQTVLHQALGRVNKLVIKTLLQNGADLNHKDEVGRTPMDMAILRVTDADIFEELLATGVSVDHSTFVRLFRKFYQRNDASCSKMLLRYFLLQHSFTENIGQIFQHSEYYDAIMRFINECINEVQKMKSEQIGEDFTLYEFVGEHASTQLNLIVQQLPRNKYNLDQLLKAIVNNAYPMYFDMISAKVGKDLEAQVLMEEMVNEKKINIYAAIYPFNSVKKIVLPSPVVHNIARFSAGDDLFRLISAFYNPHDHTCAGQSSREEE